MYEIFALLSTTDVSKSKYEKVQCPHASNFDVAREARKI